MLDYINIVGLEVYAYHGVDEEGVLGQVYIIDLRIGTDLQPAGFKDGLEYSLHYGELCLRISRVFKASNYETMEACAEVISQLLLTEYDEIEDVMVKIRKTSNRIEERTSEISVEIYRRKTRVYLNLFAMNENRQENIAAALEKIDETKYLKVVNKSSLFEREISSGTGFYKNQVVEILSLLKPIELNSFIKDLNDEINGNNEGFSDNDLFIDILFYGDEIIQTDSLTVPNPFIEDRYSVIEGLNEISPYFIHPVSKKQIRRIKDEMEMEYNFYED